MRWTINRRVVLVFWMGTVSIIVLIVAAYVSLMRVHEEADRATRTAGQIEQLLFPQLLHLRWLQNLAIAVLDPGATSANVETDPKQCDFGHWYYSGEREALEREAPYLAESLAALEKPHNQLHKAAKKINDLLAEGKHDAAAVAYREEAHTHVTRLDDLLTAMQQETRRHGTSGAEVGALAGRLRALIALIGAAAIVAAIVGLFFQRSILALLQETISVLSSSSVEIAATIAQHEKTASQQAAAANETSATITELSASARQTAEQAANAAALAEQSGSATVQGSDTTRQALTAIAGLKDRIGEMAEQILRLGEQTGQIGNIVTLVKDLSAQINMLALNAAVEAARAGEHGKGFAVVASEVRKLAVESKRSAEQAAALVADIQKVTNTSIMMTEEGTRTVAEVTDLAGKVDELFESLASMAGSVNENVQQMMLNVKQQSAAFEQVAEATDSIAAGAKETAAGIRQTKIGMEKLNEAAQNLKETT